MITCHLNVLILVKSLLTTDAFDAGESVAFE